MNEDKKQKIFWGIGGIFLIVLTLIDGFIYGHLTNKFGFDLGFPLMFALSIFIGIQIVTWHNWGEKFERKEKNRKRNN